MWCARDVPPGLTAHVEMGVALCGPFTFSDNCQPISPIIWFCTHEKLKFKLPLTFKLPHVLMDVEGLKLSFAKTYHSPDKIKMCTFEKMNPNLPTKFVSGNNPYGVLISKHHCYLCIKSPVNNSLKDLAMRKGYCLHLFIKKADALTYHFVVVCTYFLTTCIKVSEMDTLVIPTNFLTPCMTM